MADLAADPVADAPPLKAQTLDALGAALGVAALVGFVMVGDTLPGGYGPSRWSGRRHVPLGVAER